MKPHRLNDFKLVIVLLLSFTINLNLLLAQANQKTSQNLKKQTIQISKLNAKLSIDTNGIILPNNGSSDFSLIYSKETSDGYGFRMDFYKEDILNIEDFKNDYKDEIVDTINNVYYLETHTDSSTIKIGDLKYWFEKVTFRQVPMFWADMKKQVKLTSKDMTTYLNSDSDSWKKSENYLQFYTINKITKDLVKISVLYFYEDSPHIKEIEQKAKEILSGLVFLPVQQKK